MKLYYVEHQVVTTQLYALVAEDEADLKRQLAEREAIVRAAAFTPKFQRDKSGALIGYQMGPDWTYVPFGPKWNGAL